MRIFLAIVLLFGALDAGAIISASDEEIGKIAVVMKEGRDAGDQITAKWEERKNALRMGTPVAEIDKRISELSDRRKLAFNRAIWMTIQFYQILPPGNQMQQGVMRVGVNAGKKEKVTWVPQYDEHTERRRVDEKGKSKGKTSFSGDQGVSGTDGVSYIFPEAFENPDFLAGTIFHEHMHFEQLTTPGRADKLTTGQMDLEALAAERYLFKNGTLKAPPGEESRLYERFDNAIIKAASKAARELQDIKMGGSIHLDDLESRSPDDLKKIREGAVQLRKQVIREQAQDLLHKAAQKICAGPLYAGLGAGAADYRQGCSIFPDNMPWLVDDPLIKEMGGCQKEAMQRLIRCGDKDRVAAEIDEMRQRRFDDAVERFWRTAPRICSGRGSALDLTDFRAACYQLPAMPPDELAGRVKARGVTRCAGEIVDVLVASCENDDEEVGSSTVGHLRTVLPSSVAAVA